MHILQPKHTRLKQNEVIDFLKKYNIALSQLPKIKASDPCVPKDSKPGNVLKIERKDEEGNVHIYYRVVA